MLSSWLLGRASATFWSMTIIQIWIQGCTTQQLRAARNIASKSWLCESAGPRKSHRMAFHQIAIDAGEILKRGRFRSA